MVNSGFLSQHYIFSLSLSRFRFPLSVGPSYKLIYDVTIHLMSSSSQLAQLF